VQNKGRWPQHLDFLALSSAGALGLLREPASRWAAAGSILGVGPTEADVEDAAGNVADVELARHAAPLGAVLVLLVKGSTARPGPRRPRRGDGRRALLVKGSTACPGLRRPRRGAGWPRSGVGRLLGRGRRQPLHGCSLDLAVGAACWTGLHSGSVQSRGVLRHHQQPEMAARGTRMMAPRE